MYNINHVLKTVFILIFDFLMFAALIIAEAGMASTVSPTPTDVRKYMVKDVC